MIGRQKIKAPKIPPDGEPKPSRDRNGTAKSKVGEVQDPLMSGDAGNTRARIDTGEATVDEAGQVRRNKRDVDLLH